ncbi:MAG TPA: hypothetical protein DIC22_03750 [Chitinophagaceae bacterium]|nr:hypothetical protein [Chitinophagaceae bacterium]
MNQIAKYRRCITTVSLIGFCILLFAQCVNRENDKKANDKVASSTDSTRDPVDLAQFAGSASCAGCHKNIYDSHIHTAHYLTTRPALEKYIKGSFEKGKNRYAYDSGRVVVMEKRDSGLYQVGYYQGTEKVAGRFDIVVGSGSKGQTYITRFHQQLYQLPVSYFTAAGSWANSPLYPTYPVLFNRPITSRCLECHSTFVKVVSAPGIEPEEFDSQMIYGIDCERCHGPAARHVAFQSRNPKETTGKYIINPASFSRKQRLDLCALCHGGRMQKTKPSFGFVAGDKLADYFMVDTVRPDPEQVDVHGNQYGLLRSSKCFMMSPDMTCNTCHNPHENERGNIALFSSRCITCHNKEHNSFCKISGRAGPSLVKNCIDCHMPLQPSKSITELLPGDTKPTAALIRSHLIAIYPDETIHQKPGLPKIH